MLIAVIVYMEAMIAQKNAKSEEIKMKLRTLFPPFAPQFIDDSQYTSVSLSFSSSRKIKAPRAEKNSYDRCTLSFVSP